MTLAEKNIKLLEDDNVWEANNKNTLRGLVKNLIKDFKEQEILLDTVLEKM